MSVLIVGFSAVILLMIVVVTDISKVFLVRRGLDATADGAVLAAANGLATVTAHTAGDEATIDPEQAARLTADYLNQTAATTKFGNLTWSVDVEGTTVKVRLTSTVNLPFEPPGWPGASDIASEAAATVPIR
ncbi:Tad domain-containing protein [Kribbella hippodromi]